MLRPAQLYRDKLNEKFINIWYDPTYIWYALGPGLATYELPEDNHEQHAFVSVDKDDNIVGIISYTLDWEIMSAHRLGIMAFERYNLTFGRDLHQALLDIFFRYNMHRLEFTSVADNPVIASYDRWIKKYGGCRCAYWRDAAKLLDGKLHDLVSFEILADDFKKAYEKEKMKQ